MPKKQLTVNKIKITPKQQLRVTSLNMLNSPYKHAERLQMLIQEINQHKPDILNLQEVNLTVNPDTLKTIQEKTHLKNLTQLKPETTLKGIIQTNATLTHLPNPTSQEINLHLIHLTGTIINALHTTLTYNNHTIHVINVHLYWGGENEHIRHAQTQKILQTLKNTTKPEHVVILTGDYNSTPESMTLQQLKGNLTMPNTENTYWTDASQLAHPDQQTTTNTQSLLGYQTATNAGIHTPQLNIERQIDYILIKGYAHGRPGTPLNYQKWATKTNPQGLTISDHHGIMTDLYIPANP